MMELYNTLSRQIEPIKSHDEQQFSMYSCGLTVYSQPQIGNWVAYIYADVLYRVLVASGFSIKRVQNITDVGHLVSDNDSGEDKMEKGARQEGLTAWQIADKYIAIAEKEGYEWLGLLKPDQLIRATALIPEQIEFVQKLEAKGYTYIIPKEGVYFDTSKFPSYSDFAKLDVAGLEAGVRVSDAGKRNPTDFALWKFSPQDKQRDMEWDSPWGKGFPGWHLECSVIAMHSLGDQIDLHTGGIDHIPVHHSNEIAQSEALTGKQFVRYWFHNNHMKINGTKMSKSLGNSYTLSDIKNKGYKLEAFKLMVLSSHYRTEGNFTWEILEAANNRFLRWKSVADRIWQPRQDIGQDFEILENSSDQLLTILQHDLDTPRALSFIDSVLDKIENAFLSEMSCAKLQNFFKQIDQLLGISCLDKDISETQKNMILTREHARKAQDWQESDHIRDQLLDQEIGLNDTPQGTIWYHLT